MQMKEINKRRRNKTVLQKDADKVVRQKQNETNFVKIRKR